MLCWGLSRCYTQFAFAFCMHDKWMPPPVPLKYAPGLFDGPAFMGWFGGLKITHKVGTKTFFDGNPAIQHTHDAGYLIPHVAIPPNVMMGINMLTSKHKMMFPVSRVLIEGKPMGTSMFLFLSMTCSQPVSLPTGLLLPFGSTVVSKLSLADILLGLAFIAVDVIVDAIWSLIVKGDKWGKVGFGKPTPAVIKKVLDKIYKSGMSGPTGQLIVRAAAQKVVDHLGKSWALSPLFAGTVFQSAQPLTGLDRKALPSIAIGRAGLNASFFPKLKVGGNIFN